jgi:hypothetical protein
VIFIDKTDETMETFVKYIVSYEEVLVFLRPI